MTKINILEKVYLDNFFSNSLDIWNILIFLVLKFLFLFYQLIEFMSLILERIYRLQEVEDLANKAYELLSNKRIFLLTGELGAGKTTFLKHLLKEFGVKDEITSPTFSIVNEYLTARGDTVYHMDLYRINHEEELYEIGFQDTVESGALCFIEWPGIAEGLLPSDAAQVHISHNSISDRKITITTNP